MTNFGQVETQAKKLGLRVDTVRAHLRRDKYWLVGGQNWATTEPGRTLDQIKAELDAMEAGS